MYQQFTYEEARHHDALRAAHASDPMPHSAFRRHRRPLHAWWSSIRNRPTVPDLVIDLRDRRPLAPPVGFPEFLDAPDPLAVGELLGLTAPKVE